MMIADKFLQCFKNECQLLDQKRKDEQDRQMAENTARAKELLSSLRQHIDGINREPSSE